MKDTQWKNGRELAGQQSEWQILNSHHISVNLVADMSTTKNMFWRKSGNNDFRSDRWIYLAVHLPIAYCHIWQLTWSSKARPNTHLENITWKVSATSMFALARPADGASSCCLGKSHIPLTLSPSVPGNKINKLTKMTTNLSMAYNLVLLVSLSASKPLMGLLITDSPHLSWARCRLYQALHSGYSCFLSSMMASQYYLKKDVNC